MDALKETMLIWISLPLYSAIILGEMIFSRIEHKHLYTGRGLLANIYLSALNFGLDVLMRFFGVMLLLGFFYEWGGLPLDTLIHPVLYWILLIIFEDFMYYWEHRIDHTSRFFWAVHVTHHSSEEYNFSVGFRSSVFQPLYRFIYFIPIALAGFRPEDIMFTYAFTQIWGILVHTQTIKKMWAPVEAIFTTPSHHRVHHASNVRYLDRNMGMLLIVWDKIFGTFTPEDDQYQPIKYGLTTNLKEHGPVTLVFHEWANIWKDVKKAPGLKNKLMYIFGPPGWSHDGSTLTSNQLREKEAATSLKTNSSN